GCCAAGCAGGRKGCLCQPRPVDTFAGGAGERNPLLFWPGAGVVCPEEDVSPVPLERGIQAWNTSLLFCCYSNLAAIVTTASPKAPWTETGASRSGAFSLSDSLASDPLLDPLQFAYRANRSVDDAVNMALHFILQHLDTS